jgi:DNA-binding NarL/FixJ family response regulator
MIRILIADDHALMRGGLRQLFSLAKDMEVRGEAADAGTTLEALRSGEFDLVLLDLSMPGSDGVDLIAKIKARWPRLPILVLTMRTEPYTVRRALKAGVLGYVTKDVEPDVLLDAVRKVAHGSRFLQASLAEKVVFTMEDDNQPPLHERLSARELQVLRMWSKGMSIGRIATELSVSSNTISTHKARVMAKLKMASNAELLRYVLDHGLGD